MAKLFSFIKKINVFYKPKFIHRSSQSIPPFKSPVIIPETEYERNFKPSPPIKQLKQCFLEESECPRSESVEVSSGEKVLYLIYYLLKHYALIDNKLKSIMLFN